MRSLLLMGLTPVLSWVIVAAIGGRASALRADVFVLHPFRTQMLSDVYYSEGAGAGDIDGDGLDDLGDRGVGGSCIAWWGRRGVGTYARYPVVASATDVDDVELADVNGDGLLDLVVTAADTTDAVAWYENNGTPTGGGWPLRLIAYPFDGAGGTAMGDIDGSGTVDVVGVDPGRAEGITGFRKVTERVEHYRRQSNAHAWSSAIVTAASLAISFATSSARLIAPIVTSVRRRLRHRFSHAIFRSIFMCTSMHLPASHARP